MLIRKVLVLALVSGLSLAAMSPILNCKVAHSTCNQGSEVGLGFALAWYVAAFFASLL